MSAAEAIAQERRARLAAEHLLELKQRELVSANKELSKHALALTGEIIEQREEVADVRHEAAELRGQNNQALQDLEQANEAVDIAERRLWDSVETIEDGFAVFDPESLLVAANTAYLSVFDGMECVAPGISYSEIVDIMVEEGIVDIGSKAPEDWGAELRGRWGSEVLEPRTIKLWNGQFIKLVDRRSENGDTVSLALNITDTIQHEKQLQEARVKAEAANEAKSAFLAKMSHELRTPMNGVVGMADLLADSSLSEEQSLFVDTIKSSGEALLELINDVLDFSKMEAAKLALHIEDFDLERCIHDVVMLFQPALQDKNIDLIVDYDMFMPTVFTGDPGRVRQILTNLIGNAVKFTEQGHVLIRVVGLPDGETGDFRLHITVEDTGLGIPQDMVGHIFGEFNQVEDEKNRKFEGTGLGLAISKQLIELMGGEVWVDSEVGVGSNFGFHLTLPAPEGPVAKLEPLPDWVKRVGMLNGSTQASGTLAKQLRVLGIEVIDVDASKTETADLLVYDGGTNVEFNQDATDAISAYASEIPLIFLHAGLTVTMPSLDRSIATLSKPFSRTALMTAVGGLESPVPVVPVVAVPDTPSPPVVETEKPRRMRILAAEDNKTNRLVFKMLVKKLNIELQFAENGVQAVEKWRLFKPDLIFMDISMPEMDGKEATRCIRRAEEEEDLPRTPIVALTAHAMAGDDGEILAAGLDHYLTKPLRKDAIFGRIREEMPEGALAVFEEEVVAMDVE
ncbi:MAG: ATP-binding protein [Paracoccaceae bacterium]